MNIFLVIKNIEYYNLFNIFGKKNNLEKTDFLSLHN